MSLDLKNIEVRGLTDEDMPEVTEWFATRKWRVPPAGQMLPKTGYVATKGGQLLSVAWLYITNSQVAIIDWIATSPERGYVAIASVKKLLATIETEAAGATVFMHFTPNDKLAKFLDKKCGFKTTEKANVCVRRRPMEVALG